jgi:hypothetical protein
MVLLERTSALLLQIHVQQFLYFHLISCTLQSCYTSSLTSDHLLRSKTSKWDSLNIATICYIDSSGLVMKFSRRAALDQESSSRVLGYFLPLSAGLQK